MEQRYDAAIVGASTTAWWWPVTRLRWAAVSVLERRMWPAEAVTEEPIPGFRFDTGAHRPGRVPRHG
jgi:hypothetical protein